MPNRPNLLDEDGTASIATAVMMSHHGFRAKLPAARRVRSALGARMGAVEGGLGTHPDPGHLKRNRATRRPNPR
jgi:hypothetical protein